MEENILLNDIISNHQVRMHMLARYYPFFRLWDGGLSLYKEGKYADLDMPYITMAVLRYFIEENCFNDRPVTYEMYGTFLAQLIVRDFDLNLPKEESDAWIGYIFDKLCNEGKPFSVKWFDPADKKRKLFRIKLFESRFSGERIVYELTPDAIRFYLETKEIREESPMSVEQVLLGKMVVSHDFRGALDMILRINQEVSRMVAQKDEIIRLFGHNVFEGAKALEDFSKNGLRWFEEEQKMFASNKALIDQAMQMAAGGGASKEIYDLDAELKRAMQKHSELLAASTKLQVYADEMIRRAKQNSFRRSVDFVRLRDTFFEADRMEGLAAVTAPLFGLKTKKSFQFGQLEDLLDYREEDRILREEKEEGQEKTYIYEDDAAALRIENNFDYFIKVLFDQILEKQQVALTYLIHLYMMKFGEEIYRNGDFYAFLAHLSQKTDYDLRTVTERQDTFLEGMMAGFLAHEENARYRNIKFHLTFDHGTAIRPLELFEVTNIIFERTVQ